MRPELGIIILGGMICAFLVVPRDLALVILGARVYFGAAPVFFFSVGIYLAQGLIGIYLFRGSGLVNAIGRSSIMLVAAYWSYELAFKLSFLAFGPYYVQYFTRYDVYPTLLSAASIATILAIRDSFHFQRYSLAVFSFLVATWALWMITGSFPVNIQTYDANPTYLGLIYNYSTKLLGSSLFLFTVKNRSQSTH